MSIENWYLKTIMEYIDVLYLWINYEKSSFPDLLLLTLRILKFTYEYVYMYLTSTYNLSIQQFLRFLSQQSQTVQRLLLTFYFLHRTSFVRK